MVLGMLWQGYKLFMTVANKEQDVVPVKVGENEEAQGDLLGKTHNGLSDDSLDV